MRPPLLAIVTTLAALVVVGPAAAQGTSEQRAACTGDAMRLCLSALPDVGRITSCMKSHYGELSPRCQAAFHDEHRDDAKPAAPPHKLAEQPAKAPPAQTAARPAAPAPHEQARIVPREMPRGAAHDPVAHANVAHAMPVEPGSTTGGRVATHHRAPQHQLAARELAPRELSARDLPAREPLEAPTAAAPIAPAYPADVPDTLRAPPYPVIAGGPIYARPPAVTGLNASAGSLSAACRQGLIDAYTCGHTIPTLGLGE